MQRDKFIGYFQNIPVSINNLYGDPFFCNQVENTFEKLDKLRESKHTGIVSIITKSEINTVRDRPGSGGTQSTADRVAEEI